ncbi:restriction endonuclease [Streptomyces sp. NRRL B-24484]|uniref:restriction endonuclease n=1 Tax=Streptomyces sp. NRRL B-24484 TaxID=1463833 RepID=UPI0004BEBB11|nr:restriction endonuclease [Streptomyces sp. NRRL B-24484]
MQHSPDSRPDGTPSAASSARASATQTFPETAEPLQAGFLATLFRDLGAEAPDGPSEDDTVAVHARAAALTHHRTLTVQAEHEHLADLLRRAALPVSAMDFESQLRSYEPRPFPADADLPPAEAEPRWADYAPAQPPAADPDEPASRRLLDSGYQRELAQARLRHQRDLREWRARQAEGAAAEAKAARSAHEQAEQAKARAVREYNDSLEECRRAYRLSEPAAVESLLERALAAAEVATRDIPSPCRALFRPLTRTAVLDLDLPPLDVVPSLSGYRLAEDGSPEPVPRAPAERTSDYLRLAARLALRALQAADAVDTDGILAGVVLNGWLRRPGEDPVCLLSVDADRDALARTRLVAGTEAARPAAVDEDEPAPGVYTDAEQDEALLRLRELSAVVTPDPYVPVPVVPNGTAGATVPSAAELSSNEFAQLVRELFVRGGLGSWSVRLRGPFGLVATAEGAKDSGLPGRWVVWASRNTDPVAADELRTLAEAVREEGAERGLRLTTGRFGEAALDLAAEEGYRRIHLIDGEGVRELSRTHLGLPLAAG